MPTRVYFGRGSLGEAPSYLTEFKNLLVVAGGHLRLDPAWERFVNHLSLNGANVINYPEMITRSDVSQIDRLLQFMRLQKVDGVIAAGGGTIIDSVKSAAYLALTTGSVGDYLAGKTLLADTYAGLPVIAIPTTAGTGSEVTPWAVVWGSDGKKYSIQSAAVFPLMAIVDPALTDQLPALETALTGADALTQAVESYWSNRHNSISDQYALEAIAQLSQYLSGAVNKPTPELRDKVMHASLLSGLAFSNTQTTLCHAISYPLTIKFGIPHGQAVVVTLSTLLPKMLSCLTIDRQQALLRAFGAPDVNAAINGINELITSIGLRHRLDDLGLTIADLPELSAVALAYNRAANSPWLPSVSELASILGPLVEPNTVDRKAERHRRWMDDLLKVTALLDVVGTRYWLDMGTLLGAIRERDFIGWDGDIDISALTSDAPKVLSLSDQFAGLGYRVDVTDSSVYLSAPGRPTIGLAFYEVANDRAWLLFLVKPPIGELLLKHVRRVAEKIIYQPYHRGLPSIEAKLYAMIPVGWRMIVRRVAFSINYIMGERHIAMVVPAKCVAQLGIAKLGEVAFPAPHLAEEYLAHIYGNDWRTPKSNWRWEDTKAIDREFFKKYRRSEYLLPRPIINLEKKIIQQWERDGGGWLEGIVEDNNFELRAIMDRLGPSIDRPKLLDVGSGRGRFTAKLRSLGFDVVGIDPVPAVVQSARELYPDVNFQLASATSLPFPDHSFDLAICVETLEHIPDTQLAIQEINRVLKPGGKLIIIDKNIRSFHHLYFIPTALWKWWRESTGRWFYPPQFPFREKYFLPDQLSHQLSASFSQVQVTGLPFKPTKRDRSWWLRSIWNVHQAITGLLHHWFPGYDFYQIWTAVK